MTRRERADVRTSSSQRRPVYLDDQAAGRYYLNRYYRRRAQALATPLPAIKLIAASAKNGVVLSFTTPLERDFSTLLEFDPGVARYDLSPIDFRYSPETADGWNGPGTFLVMFRPEIDRIPIFVDVVDRHRLFGQWPRGLKLRLKNARRRAVVAGWDYAIRTECEVQTPFLENARFLLPHLHATANEDLSDRLLRAAAAAVTSTPKELLQTCSSAFDDPAAAAKTLLPALWHLVGQRVIKCDLDEPLDLESTVWYKAQA